MCLYPKLIKNKKYQPNKKNKGNVPVCTDNRLLYVTAACGHCYECRSQKARQWMVRMCEEIRQNNNAIFVTLTISEECYEMIKNKDEDKDENDVATRAVRLWLERVRKQNKRSIKHWLITERGHESTKRVHLHGIIWDDNATEWCKEKWNYGYVFIGSYVNERTIKYIIKYVTKMDEENHGFQGKILCSAGIGSGFVDRADAKMIKNKMIETYRLRDGSKVNLPIYYRNKIYTEEDREELWKKKLDKGIVYVCGEPVNIDDEKSYYSLLKFHQERAVKLNGDDPEKWESEKYLRKVKRQRELIKKRWE